MTALGGKKQDRKIGYATTTVKGDDLARTNAISPINALQGKVAGLNIGVSGSSGLTSTPMVTLRGAKSLDKNNSPIYVIDGIVMENEYGTNATNNSGNLYGNQLKNLNQADFESVTVLKGAAATSLYGSRGANGAIVITTKGGKARNGIGVEVNYTHEFTQLYAAPIALQNLYGMGSAFNGYEGDVDPNLQSTASEYTGESFGPRMDAGIVMKQNYKLWQGREGYEYNPEEPLISHPDNWKSLFQTGKQDNVSVALTGGSDKATYRLSYGYTSMKGALPNNDFSRHSINFRTNGKINDVFSVDFSMQYSNTHTLNAASIDAFSSSFLKQVSGNLARNTDLKWFRDNYIDYSTYERMVPGDGPSSLRSLQSALNTFVDQNVDHTEQTIISRLALNAQFTDWLDASASISYNYFTKNDETKNWGSDKYRMGSGNKYAISGSNEGKYNSLITLHSNNRFVDDNLELDVRLINEMYGNQAGASYSRTTRGGLKIPGIFSFANTKDPIEVSDLSSSWNRRNNMVVGLGGVVNLSWKDQINLEVTARNDWISSLLYPDFMLREGAHDNYSVFYPSVNLSWVFSDTFQIDPNVLSFGKLRASWGQVGSGTSAYATSKGAGGYNFAEVTPVTGSNIFKATPNDGTLANYDLKPEIQQSMEFGADLRFLNGAIGVDVAYYKINTKNQILSLDAVKESGVSTQLINAGNIQNQGWEIALDFRPIQTNTVRWNIGLLWSRNRGKVKELHPNATKYKFFNDGSARLTPAIYAFEGGAFGQIVAGTGYGTTSSQAYYYDRENPNNPLNGKKALNYLGDNVSNGLSVTVWQNNGNMPGVNKNSEGKYYDNYFNTEHTYDVLGKVEPDFSASFNTNLMVNLPNNNGSLDFFAQIDGRVGGNIISTSYVEASSAGSNKGTLYGRDAEHGGVERVNYKGDVVYNGMILDGVYAGRNRQLAKTLNGEGSYVNDAGETIYGTVDLRGMTMRDAIDKGYIAPMLSSAYYQYQFVIGNGRTPTDYMVYDGTYFSLREITVGYNFPQKWIKYVGLQDARLSFSARNICYIYNKLPDHINPESMSSANPLVPIDWGGVPYTRNFSINLNLRF